MPSICRRFLVLMFLCAFAAAPAAARATGDVLREVDLLSGFKTEVFWTDGVTDTAAAARPQCDGPELEDARLVPFTPAAAGAWTARDKRPAIAIVIDDVGLDIKRSQRATDLPPGVTLAFLPYSHNVAAQAKAAAAKGHELMVHLPMEPQGMRANPGPNYLGVNHTAEELEKRIAANLDAFSGYAGVNNHMGSAFTSYAPGMKVFMRALKKRNVFFLDSKTAPESVAESAARDAGILTTHRDVFLDHYEDAAHVRAALEQVEHVARKYGSAVAIGHPKDVTLDALQQWLPTLEAKGFDLVPMSEMIARRHKRDRAHTAAVTRPVEHAVPAPQTPVSEETAAAAEAMVPAPVAAAAAADATETEKPATSKILPSHRRYNR